MKKSIFYILAYIFLAGVFFFGATAADAYYKDGTYVNIYGAASVNCKNPEACESYSANWVDNCKPDSGTCDTSQGVTNPATAWWVYKWICAGKPAADKMCGGGTASPLSHKKVQAGTFKVDGDGVTCGQTVQLDVYDKDPEAAGGWDSTAVTKDYLVWYSGDCPVPTNTPPAPACDTSCAGNPNICQQAGGGCTFCNPSSNKCERPPACGTSCKDNPSICQQTTDGCTVCNTTTNQCEKPGATPGVSPPPGSTPVVTQPPACGVSCDGRPSICDTIPGCTVCSLTSKRCEPPGSTPIVTQPPVCGASCDGNPNICTTISGCTVCSPTTKRCEPPGSTPTVTVSQPTPTATPASGTATCKCDGFDASTLIPGSAATFTSFAKVEGTDISKATVKDITFSFAKGNDITTTRIAKSDPIPASAISGSAGRYKASWNYTLPANLERGAVYSVWANINCVKSPTALNSTAQPIAYNSPSDTAVLGAEDQPQSFWSKISSFFAGLFGQKPKAVPTSVKLPTPLPTSGQATTTVTTVTPAQNISTQSDGIQLGTFRPAQIITKACPIMKFRVQ